MVQILLLWDSTDSKDVKVINRIKKGLENLGYWSAKLPPQGSLYKEVLVLKEETKDKE